MEPVGAHTIGLLAAVDDELGPTIKRLKLELTKRVYFGHMYHMRIVAMVSGIGGDRAIGALHELVERYRAKQVIHLGFAGGLDPALRVGEVRTFQWVINPHEQAMHLTGAPPIPTDGITDRRPGHTLLTMDHLVDSVRSKHQLFKDHGACAVDMECFPVAVAAATMALRFTALRAISDTADTVIPVAAIKWINSDGSRRIASVAKYLARRPWKLPAILRLHCDTTVAAECLATRVTQLLAGEMSGADSFVAL